MTACGYIYQSDIDRHGHVVSFQDAKQSALTLSNVSGIFHILIGGLGLSMVASLFAYAINRKMKMDKSSYKVRCNAINTTK
jgi:hypothetical protein